MRFSCVYFISLIHIIAQKITTPILPPGGRDPQVENPCYKCTCKDKGHVISYYVTLGKSERESSRLNFS
jgi:hypothetical protein